MGCLSYTPAVAQPCGEMPGGFIRSASLVSWAVVHIPHQMLAVMQFCCLTTEK